MSELNLNLIFNLSKITNLDHRFLMIVHLRKYSRLEPRFLDVFSVAIKKKRIFLPSIFLKLLIDI